MKTLSLVGMALLFSSVSALGANAPIVAKLTASLCDGGKTLETSAVLFRFRQKAYALTSQAGALNSQQVCHQIFAPEIGEVSGKLLSSDKMHGLALFELPSVSAALVGWDIEKPENEWHIEVRRGMPLTFQGFRKGEQSRESSSGRMMVTEGNRHWIPKMAYAFEVRSAQVTSGLVGGAVLSEHGSWLGLITDRFLKLVPGTTTQIGEWDLSSAKVVSQPLVYPYGYARYWAVSVIEGTVSKRGSAYIDPQDQLNGVRRAQWGKLLFTEDCPSVGSGNGRGADGYPIGGADGIGIGGNANAQHACKMKVEKASRHWDPAEEVGSPLEGNWGGVTNSSWHEPVLAGLATAPSAEAWFFYFRNGGELRKWNFGSLSEFLYLSIQGNGSTMLAATFQRPAVSHPGLRPDLEALTRAASLVSAEAVSLYSSVSLTDVQLLLRKIFLLSKAIESEDVLFLKSSDITVLLDRNGQFARAWGLLEAPEFFVRSPLRSQLTGVLNEWKRLGLGE